MSILGIDPGAKGGWCLLDHLEMTIRTGSFGPTEQDTLDEIPWMDVTLAGIEKVQPMPHATKDQRGHGMSGAFKLGYNYGLWCGWLWVRGVPMERVPARTWQKALGLITGKKMTPTEKKNLHKQKAQELHPDHKITHATADAILIAHYLHREWVRHG